MLASLVLAVAVSTLPPASAAGPVDAARLGLMGGTEDAPSLRLIGQDGEVAAGGTFTVFLQIDDAPAGSELAVDLYQRIDDAPSLAASSDGEPQGTPATFAVVPLATGLRASQQSGFAIVDGPAGPWSSPMSEPGVYPVRVRLRGPDSEVLTSLVTYLVRTSATESQPTRVAVVAEVHQPPGPSVDPVSEETNASGQTEPTTGRALQPIPIDAKWRGQVDDMVEVLSRYRSVPISFSITPETADALSVDPQDTTLAGLRREVARPGGELLGGTYVDIDVAALTDEGLGDVVLRQTDLGQRTLQRIFGNPGSATWHLEDAVDRPAAELLRVVGVSRLLLPPGSLGPDPSLRPVSLGAGLDLLATTESPNNLAVDPVDPVLAGHQLLGALAALASFEADQASAVLVVDPTTVDFQQLAVVLDGLERRSRSLRPATVTNVIDSVPPDPEPYEPEDRVVPDLGLYPDRTHRTQELLANYASMVADPAATTEAYEVPLAQAASRDLPVAERLERLGRLEDSLEAFLAGISLPERDRITLGARDAAFPLRITSQLEAPVDVLVSFDASDRLEVPEAPVTLRLEPGSTLLEIPVQIRASGDTQLRIRVTTPDGRYLLAESRYTIRSTVVSGVGLLLTVGAGAFLALWWGRHFLRSRRDNRPRHARGRARPSSAEPTPARGDEVFVDEV